MWPTIYITPPYLDLRFHISSAKQQSWQLSMDIHLQASSARICQAYTLQQIPEQFSTICIMQLLCHNTFFTKQSHTNTFHTLSASKLQYHAYMNYFTNLSPLVGARCCYHSCERSTYLVLHLRNIILLSRKLFVSFRIFCLLLERVSLSAAFSMASLCFR